MDDHEKKMKNTTLSNHQFDEIDFYEKPSYNYIRHFTMQVKDYNPLVCNKGFPFDNAQNHPEDMGRFRFYQNSHMAASAILKSKDRVDGINTSNLNQGNFTNMTLGKVRSDFIPDFNELNNIHPVKSFYHMLPSGQYTQFKVEDYDIVELLKKSKADNFTNLEELKSSIMKTKPNNPKKLMVDGIIMRK